MSDDKTKKIPQDANRISITDPDEVRYWCDKFHCTEKELKKAVCRVGDSAVEVEQEIQRIKEQRISRDPGLP